MSQLQHFHILGKVLTWRIVAGWEFDWVVHLSNGNAYLQLLSCYGEDLIFTII